MNLKRKILRMVDLRVHQYWAAERHDSLTRHAPSHPALTLTSDTSGDKTYAHPDRRSEAFL